MVLFSAVSSGVDTEDDDDGDGGEFADVGMKNSRQTSKNMEMAWRYIKKPLLSIGSKGVVPSHATSLRDLLLAHTAVKIKIRHADGLEAGFQRFAQLLSDQHELELLHCRESDGIIMVGGKGTIDLIESGKFPPAKPQTGRATRS
jgi:RNA-binding protein YhbY